MPSFGLGYLSPPTNTQSSPSKLSNSKMRVYLKNGMYILSAFLTMCIFKTVLHISSVNFSGEVALNEELSMHPRFRRNILDIDTTLQSSSIQDRKDFNSIREGPSQDFGPSTPEKWAEDVLISVKTTGKFHSTRLKDILDTWFRLAPEKIFFFTDTKDESADKAAGGHLINTGCSRSHSRQALCCKLGTEFQFFLRSGKRWFCHFDDDNYVNVPELKRLLTAFDPRRDWYLGRPSTRGPIQILDRDNLPSKISFWFATGGAGFCISRSLALKMEPFARREKFVQLGDNIRLPDDVTMGYLVEHILGGSLTVIDRFHSHLESMRMIPRESLPQQVSLSAGSYNSLKNVVDVEEVFPEEEDPSHFKSLHCYLYPSAKICPSS